MESKDYFLDTIRIESRILTPERRLRYVLSMMKDNAAFRRVRDGLSKENPAYHRYYFSKEIFKAAYGDPEGIEYWHRWFDKSNLLNSS
jgi:hypothetical protein